MTDLPKALRERLAAAHVVRWPEVTERAVSLDGTIKFLFELDDGATIESVFIPEERRRTICISTQAGCPLKCAFCLTGIGGYKRNLKPWEILGQVAVVMADAPPADMPWNIVIMGMGEPLLNYEATVAVAAHPDGPRGVRGLPEEAHAVHGGDPARPREAHARARAPEPRHQPARLRTRRCAAS